MREVDWGVLVVLGALLGVKMLLLAHFVARRRESDDVSSLGPALLVSGLVTLGVSVFALVVGFVAIAKEYAAGNWNAGAAFAFTLAVLYVSVVALGGVFELLIARAAWSSEDIRLSKSLDRNVALLKAAGWAVVCIFAGTVTLSSLMVGLIPLLLVVAVAAFWRSKRQSEQATFMWLLTFAVEQKQPLTEELEAFSRTLWGKAHRRCRELIQLLRAGVPIDECLDRIEGIVTRADATAIHVALQTGTLPATLRQLAVARTADLQEAGRRRGFGYLMVYFWFLLSAIISVTSFHMYYIVPKLEKIFEDFGAELPGVTLFVIRVSHQVINYFWLIAPLLTIPAIAIVVVGVIHFRGGDPSGTGSLAFWLPRLHTVPLLRNLARVVGARRPLTEGLDSIAESYASGMVHNKLQRAKRSAESGADCWEALRHEGLISRRQTAAIHSAESADNLTWVLGALADEVERRRATRLVAFGEIARPIFVICVGFVVIIIAVGFFLPLVKLLNDLS